MVISINYLRIIFYYYYLWASLKKTYLQIFSAIWKYPKNKKKNNFEKKKKNFIVSKKSFCTQDFFFNDYLNANRHFFYFLDQETNKGISFFKNS